MKKWAFRNQDRPPREEQDSIYVAPRAVQISKNVHRSEDCTKPVPTPDANSSVSHPVAACAHVPGRYRQLLKVCRETLGPTTESIRTTCERISIVEAQEILLRRRPYRLRWSLYWAWQTWHIDESNQRKWRETAPYPLDLVQALIQPLFCLLTFCTDLFVQIALLLNG